MLKLKLEREGLFTKFLEAILDLVDVANVDCSSTGLNFQAVDTEHVAIIALFFPAKHFNHYLCDKKCRLRLPIADMVKAIRCADEDDITIKVGDKNFDTITLSFKSPKANKTTVKLRLVDANSKRLKIPDEQVLDSTYQALVKMPSVEFMRICKYLGNIGGDGDISATEKDIRFLASGTSGCVDIKYKKPKEAADTFVVREPVSLTLNLKYMNYFVKASTLFEEVKICLSKTQPLVVECKFGKMEEMMGYMRYCVIPKVELDMEESKDEGIIQGAGEGLKRKRSPKKKQGSEQRE